MAVINAKVNDIGFKATKKPEDIVFPMNADFLPDVMQRVPYLADLPTGDKALPDR